VVPELSVFLLFFFTAFCDHPATSFSVAFLFDGYSVLFSIVFFLVPARLFQGSLSGLLSPSSFLRQ